MKRCLISKKLVSVVFDVGRVERRLRLLQQPAFFVDH